MADSKKWKDEEARKQQEAQSQMNQAAQDAARQTQEQAAASLQSLIAEFNGLDHRDSTTDDKITSAKTYLEQLNGTETYDSLKQALDEAVNHVLALPKQDDSSKPQEIGPGMTKPRETTAPVFPGDSNPQSGGEVGNGPGDDDTQAEAVGPGME